MSGKSKTTTSQTSNPWQPAQGALQQQLSGARSYMSNPISRAVYTGPRVAAMSDITKSGIDGFANPSAAQGALGYYQRVMNGDYLNPDNSYVKNLQQSITDSVMPGVNATFARAGMFGGTTNQGVLARSLTDGMAAPMFNLYGQERAAQQAAAGAIPGIEAGINQNRIAAGQVGEGYTQRQYDAAQQLLRDRQAAALNPYLSTLPITTAIGGMGGKQTGTQTQRQPAINSILGAGMMGASMFGSGGLFGGASPFATFGAYNPQWPTTTG